MGAASPAGAPHERKPLILVVDDDEDIRNLFAAALHTKYELKFAAGGDEALVAADTEPLPDLILLDVEMPGMDGYEVCSRLKSNPALAPIPVIFVSAHGSSKDQAKGLMLGAVDYISKPISAPIVMLRVRAQLALYDQRRALEDQVQERTRELQATRQQLIRRLARAMEYREGGLTNRVLRVSHYAQLLGLALGLKEEVCEALMQAAPLYDIGKMGVAENILRKTEIFNKKDWEEMRKHPEIGAKIIGAHKDPLLETARVMALTHHERWDGSGYPKGLKGEAIPLPGRIMALADAFEAMTATQRHREPLSVVEATAKIVGGAGKQFDPAVVTAFRKVVPNFTEVKKAYPDELEGIHDLNFTIELGDAPPQGGG